MNAGYPTKDYAIDPAQIPDTQAKPGPKLFVIYPEDTAALEALQLIYPEGYLERYPSQVENKDFMLFYVLPEE
jgi:hypothetical protein